MILLRCKEHCFQRIVVGTQMETIAYPEGMIVAVDKKEDAPCSGTSWEEIYIGEMFGW